MTPYGPLIKYAAMGLAVVLFAAGLIAYGAHLKQIQWDAAIARQAIEAGENLIKNAENTARIESEFQRKLQAQAEKVRIVKKEVKVYVEGPATKCVLTPEFERVFDAVSRMYDPTTDGLPAATDPAGAAVVAPDTPLTDSALLRAYENAVIELFELWGKYDALRDWVRSSHAIAREGAGRP